MRILFANYSLRERTGSEMYVADLVSVLTAKGHDCGVYSPRLGPLAEVVRQAGVAVVPRPERLPWQPDLIHGNGRAETQAALKAFPGVPALFVCHDHVHWSGSPPLHPAVRRYLGVSRLCLERLRREGVEDRLIALSLNWVNLERFRPRAPLPPQPQRALVFSNYATEDTHLPAVRQACHQAGIQLDVAGIAVGHPLEWPELVLGEYDLVFAKAKAALEAMAVGTAVVLCDFGGVGPLVTSGDFDRLRELNFGYQALTAPLEARHLREQIRRYDPVEAALVRDRVRAEAGLEGAAARLLATYQEVMEENWSPPQGRPTITPRRRLIEAKLGLGIRLQVAWSQIPRHHRRRLATLPGVSPLKRGLSRMLLGSNWEVRRPPHRR